jgi:iron complex transport system substrate-binding protein
MATVVDKKDNSTGNGAFSGFGLILCFFLVLFLSSGEILFVRGSRAAQPSPQSARKQRLVSLGPAVTEKLYLLGVQDRVVGVTTYCKRPPAALTKEKVGSVTEVNVEKITELRPDLVLATAFTHPRTVKRLTNLGLKVIVLDEPQSFEQMNRQFLELGRLIGRQEAALGIVRMAEQRVAELRQRVRNQPRPRIFVQIGARPLFTATGNTFLNDMVERAGAINIARDAPSGLYSREEVLFHDPDIILIVTMGIVAENEKKVWQKFPALAAARQGRIFVLDPYQTCSPNPQTFADAAQSIAEAAHPSLKTASAPSHSMVIAGPAYACGGTDKEKGQ